MGRHHHYCNNIDFEIAFCEGILTKAPDFMQALMVLGDLYTKKGWYEKGLEIDRKLSQLRPHDPLIQYNLACSYSLMNDIDAAFRSIKRAIRCGYDDFQYLWQDKDLENLIKTTRFRLFFKKLTEHKGDLTLRNKPDAGAR